MVDFNLIDHFREYDYVCTKINSLVNTKHVVVVAHSYGCFYALRYAELYPTTALILLDPPPKTDLYKTYLKSNMNLLDECKLEHFDKLPDGANISNNVAISVHVSGDSESKDSLFDKISYFSKLTKNNSRSNLIVHYDTSHMIHYTRSANVIENINRYL